MKLIAYEGPHSKYTQGSTRNSIVLGINTDFVSGIRLDVYITKDNVLVAMGPEGFIRTGLTKEAIENTNYDTIIRHNIGTNVQKHAIISVREVFNIYSKNNTNDILLLNIVENQNKGSIIVDSLKELNESYPSVNLYLESSDKEIMDYLLSTSFNAKKGQIIINDKEINNKLDFYSFSYNKINETLIKDLYSMNKEIIISDVDNKEQLLNIYNMFKDIFEDIYIESNNVAMVNSTYILNIKNSNRKLV